MTPLKVNILRGMLIYAAGDTLASILTCGFSLLRLAGVMAVGALIYSFEIPAWFRWLNLRFSGIARAGMAVLYFNPLWIARHLSFICLFSRETGDVSPDLLVVALKGFTMNLPLVFAANYLIQNRIPLKWRFLSSAAFSSLMAVYYPLCRIIFK